MKGYTRRSLLRAEGESGRAKGIENSMDKKLKQQFLLVAFGVALYAALMNLGAVARFLLVVRLILLQLLQKTHCFLSRLKKAVCADRLSVYTHPLSVSRFGARLISRWTIPRTSAPL